MKPCGLSHLTVNLKSSQWLASPLCFVPLSVPPSSTSPGQTGWDWEPPGDPPHLSNACVHLSPSQYSPSLFLLTAYLAILFHPRQYAPLPPLISYEFLIYCIMYSSVESVAY